MTSRRTTLLLLPALAGCYVYASSDMRPARGDDVRLFLNDRGRAELTSLIGPSVRSLTGEIVATTDSDLTISVKESASTRGVSSEWNGERVTIGTALVDSARTHRISAVRTAAAAIGGVAFVALVRAAFGGGSNGGSGPTSGPPTQ
jgi:hypothetical protein